MSSFKILCTSRTSACFCWRSDHIHTVSTVRIISTVIVSGSWRLIKLLLAQLFKATVFFFFDDCDVAGPRRRTGARDNPNANLNPIMFTFIYLQQERLQEDVNSGCLSLRARHHAERGDFFYNWRPISDWSNIVEPCAIMLAITIPYLMLPLSFFLISCFHWHNVFFHIRFF